MKNQLNQPNQLKNTITLLTLLTLSYLDEIAENLILTKPKFFQISYDYWGLPNFED